MRQYRSGKARLARLLTVVLTTSLLTVLSCSDETERTDKAHNLSMSFSTRAGETGTDLVPTTRLFNFHPAGPNENKFYQEVLNLKRSDNTIKANVEAGQWNMALVANPYGGTIIAPEVGTHISQQPLYKYVPTYVEGVQTTNAHELFLDNQLVSITGNTDQSITAQLNRTVARVDLIIKKTTPNFKTVSAKHKIKLRHIPSTISYTGDFLPSAAAPDTLPKGLEAPITLNAVNSSYYEGSETITFIIPAHRGAAVSGELVGVKMGVEVILERTGGTMFDKQEQISVVAECNKILQVEITVNDGLEFKTNILNWEAVDMKSDVGAGYQNWLYVKHGVNGNGLTWSDPLPSINAAITKAQVLNGMGADKKVNGILVAGGSSLVYNEGLDIPEGIKIYGGWKGTAGTELAYNNIEGPYTAPVEARNLSTHKAVINLGSNMVQLTKANAVLDGFIIQGAAAGNTNVVTVSNPAAWINAIEIKNNQNTSGTALMLSGNNTTATNILVCNNTRGVNIGAGTKLVNATIVKNNTASTFAGTLLNSVYWGNPGTPTISGTINYCAFNGTHTTMPAGTNYPIHASNNTAWIVQGSAIPGPHFTDANSNYTAVSNRSPMLGRGDEDVFTGAITGKMPLANKTDIDGNPRSYETIDIGCYESPGVLKGFEFRWNMTDVYISTKKLIVSDHPALLYDNAEGAYVEWKIEANPTGSLFTVADGSPTSGAGTGTTLGYFHFKSGATANTGNNDKLCGTVKFTSENLGVYLPEETKNVYQTPGTSKVWNEGYAGSFHRWDETGPRYISGTNSGVWIARIISGHEWIKIDGRSRPTVVDGDVEVEETFGGVVRGDGPIIFRVGMKSTLPRQDSDPRYGLISITRTVSGVTGNALFFVRQGEKADYLYGPDDDRVAPYKNSSGTVIRTEYGREFASKFTVYNMTDPQGRFNAAGQTLSNRGGGFVDYPSKGGYYFKYNDLRAFYPDTSPSGTVIGTSYQNTAWSTSREVCPEGYHTPTEPEFTHSYFLNRPLHYYRNGDADGTTFVWGRLADGYFDKYATSGSYTYGSGINKAHFGLLMYNDYNNASVFFPITGRRTTSNTIADGTSRAWYWTSSSRTYSDPGTDPAQPYKTNSDEGWATHCGNNHLGMSCTQMFKRQGGNVRCVEGNTRRAPTNVVHE